MNLFNLSLVTLLRLRCAIDGNYLLYSNPK